MIAVRWLQRHFVPQKLGNKTGIEHFFLSVLELGDALWNNLGSK